MYVPVQDGQLGVRSSSPYTDIGIEHVDVAQVTRAGDSEPVHESYLIAVIALDQERGPVRFPGGLYGQAGVARRINDIVSGPPAYREGAGADAGADGQMPGRRNIPVHSEFLGRVKHPYADVASAGGHNGDMLVLRRGDIGHHPAEVKRPGHSIAGRLQAAYAG